MQVFAQKENQTNPIQTLFMNEGWLVEHWRFNICAVKVATLDW